MSRYIFPALVLVLLLLFYLGLPDLSATPMYSLEGQRKRRRHTLDRADWLIMLGITVLFGAVDFTQLGSISAPHTFHRMAEEEAVLTFDQAGCPSEISFFTGV